MVKSKKHTYSVAGTAGAVPAAFLFAGLLPVVSGIFPVAVLDISV